MLRNVVLTLALAGMLYSVTPSRAQENSTPTQEANPPAGAPEHARRHFDPARRADMMTQHLQLTSDQHAKVLDILQSAQSQMEGLRSDTSTSRDEKRSKMMEIRKSADDQIRAVLDSNQQNKWDEMQSRREERHGQHGAAESGSSSDSSQQK
jgi:protein CpxP